MTRMCKGEKKEQQAVSRLWPCCRRKEAGRRTRAPQLPKSRPSLYQGRKKKRESIRIHIHSQCRRQPIREGQGSCGAAQSGWLHRGEGGEEDRRQPMRMGCACVCKCACVPYSWRGACKLIKDTASVSISAL